MKLLLKTIKQVALTLMIVGFIKPSYADEIENVLLKYADSTSATSSALLICQRQLLASKYDVYVDKLSKDIDWNDLAKPYSVELLEY